LNIFKDSSFLFASNILLVALSLLTGVLTARFLGPTGKGEFYLMLQASSLASLILSGGLGSSYQYHLKKKLLDQSNVISHILIQSLIVTLILCIALALFEYKPLGILNSTLPSNLLFPIIVATILNVEVLYANSILMTFSTGIRTSSVLSALSSVIYVMLLAIFLWGMDWGIKGAIAAYLVSLVVRLVPTIVTLLSQEPLRLRLTWRKHSPTLFAFGLSSFLCNIMLSSVFRVDVFIVNSLAGVSAVGIYSVAVAFAEMALMAPNAIGIALFSHLPGISDAEQISVVGRSSRITIFLAFICGALLALISRPLVIVLMGVEFAGAVIPLIILIPGLIMMSVNYVFANYYSAQGKPLVSAYCFGIGLVFNVVANLFLIPLMGINGAALASTISYACITLCFFVILRRQHQFAASALFFPNINDMTLIRGKVNSFMGGICRVRPSSNG